MLDSPFEYCRICRDYVLLDQTRVECVREHGCAETPLCPLRAFFTGIDFGATKGKARAEPGRHRD